MAIISAPTPRSPLAGARSDDGAVRERGLCAKSNLRGKPENAEFTAACESALGLALPLDANTTAEHAETRAFWLGPDEWLVHAPVVDAATTLKALREALDGVHAAVTEVSDYYTVLDLRSPLADAVLATGSSFDTRGFAPGQCAQIRFAHASLLVWPEAAQHYGVQVRWSHARYLFDYFQQSVERLQALAAFSAE